MNLEIIQKVAYDLFGTKRSHYFKEQGNKYYHGQRVAKLAITLKNIILPDDRQYNDIITVAAWFHDISNGDDDHAKKGAKVTRDVLSNYCSQDEINKICEIISDHDNRSTNQDFSNYAKIHQDADHLDHFGTFDIWSTFIHAVPNGKSMEDIVNIYQYIRPAEFEIYRRELNFEISKKIFDEKFKFVEQFGKRFAVESTGEIWNLETILRTE